MPPESTLDTGGLESEREVERGRKDERGEPRHVVGGAVAKTGFEKAVASHIHS